MCNLFYLPTYWLWVRFYRNTLRTKVEKYFISLASFGIIFFYKQGNCGSKHKPVNSYSKSSPTCLGGFFWGGVVLWKREGTYNWGDSTLWMCFIWKLVCVLTGVFIWCLENVGCSALGSSTAEASWERAEVQRAARRERLAAERALVHSVGSAWVSSAGLEIETV